MIRTIELTGDTSFILKKQTYKKETDNMPLHKHDFLTISLVLAGSVFEKSTEATNFARSGGLSIKPAGILHSDVFTENCTIISLKIYDWAYYDFHFDTWQWIPDSLAIKHFLHVIYAKDKKESLKTLNDFLKAKDSLNTSRGVLPEWLADTHTIVTQHFQEPLQVADLARNAGKHPVHLARTFKAYFGMDLKTYQKHLRIQHVMEDAMKQKQNLTQLAYASGFADQSHFSREFKKITGIPPKKATTLLHV